MIIQRDLLEKIKPFLKRKEYLAILGPRQCGKTVFLEIIKKHLISVEKNDEKHVHIITFEDRRLLRQFEREPVSFASSYAKPGCSTPAWLMIDEFQYAEEGGQKLKLVYDTVKNLKIIVTGSSSLELKARTGRYMVGRILTFLLYPFDFAEYLRARDSRLERIQEKERAGLFNWLSGGKIPRRRCGEDAYNEEMEAHYEKYCVWGGYPAVVLSATDRERLKVLADIYSGYILKDIKGLLELSTDRNLVLLAQHLSAQTGNIVVYGNLGNESMLDFRKLKGHLNVLMETFICAELRPFFVNRQKELSKNPKIYFYDQGFRNYLIENMNPPERRPDAGAVIENAVFVRFNSLREDLGRINFWRTKAGAEVDFVIHTAGSILPVEVKYSSFENPKISKSFASFIETFKPARGLILTKKYWGYLKRNSTEIIFAPVYYI
ncbi:MAG: ATP-binding protein [Elusimicrobia bacterium]|nr:ATP-binding protein [Elusimicrobiota bacterium]